MRFGLAFGVRFFLALVLVAGLSLAVALPLTPLLRAPPATVRFTFGFLGGLGGDADLSGISMGGVSG